MGGLAFVFGFAMVWWIWWLAILCRACHVGHHDLALVGRRDRVVLVAEEVERLEKARYRELEAAKAGRP